ncbi:Sodium/hydrogen exchanger [Arachis hypogaea]|nr:Sodium/hydrogen exchanger [Arachis hypogaea]
MLDEGQISQMTANILMLSVEEAIDLASHEPLCDWKGLKSNVHFPNYYKFLQFSMLLPKLVTYFTVERLESACNICAAFLRAHRVARQQLHDFIGVVKTRQATYVVLNHLIEYVQDLEKAGILEEKEMLHLHDAVQTDLKKLFRNPPLVKLPKITSMHPMLGALPSPIRESLISGTREVQRLESSLVRFSSSETVIAGCKILKKLTPGRNIDLWWTLCFEASVIKLIVVMASHCYLVGSSGELFIEYFVWHCALTDNNRGDLDILNKRVEYMMSMIIILLLEGVVTADILLNSDWEKDLPEDPTGKFNDFKDFVESNFDVCKWIILVQTFRTLCSYLKKALNASINSATAARVEMADITTTDDAVRPD